MTATKSNFAREVSTSSWFGFVSRGLSEWTIRTSGVYSISYLPGLLMTWVMREELSLPRGVYLLEVNPKL